MVEGNHCVFLPALDMTEITRANTCPVWMHRALSIISLGLPYQWYAWGRIMYSREDYVDGEQRIDYTALVKVMSRYKGRLHEDSPQAIRSNMGL